MVKNLDLPLFQPQPKLNYLNEDIPEKSHLWASLRN